jgi:hypothetical protein
MNAPTRAFDPKAFIVGHVMARGITPARKRVMAGVLLGVSPTPLGIAAAFSVIRSARRATRREKPDDAGGEGTLESALAPDSVPRQQLLTDAKEMIDAVTEAAGAISEAARSSTETSRAALDAFTTMKGQPGARRGRTAD